MSSLHNTSFVCCVHTYLTL